MLKLSKYINNIRALQLFQIIRTGVLFLISIIFTKTNPFSGEVILSVNDIGIYEMFLLIAGFVSSFWINGMLQSLLSVYGNNKTFNSQEERNPIFFNVFILFLSLGVLASLLVLGLQQPIAKFMGLGGNDIPYVGILSLYIIISCPVNLVEYIYLLKNKPLHIIYYAAITFTLQLICLTFPLFLGYGLEYVLYGLIFINIIRFIWLLFLIHKYSIIKLSSNFIEEFLHISSPLVLSMLISGSATYIDSFLVSYKFGEEAIAVFRYGKEFPIVILLTTAFGNAIMPSFSDPKNLKRALLELKNGTTKLMHYIFPASLAILLTSKYLFPIIFNESFNESAIIFNINILIIAARFIFARIIIIGIQKTKIIFKISIVEIILNIMLSIILMDVIGIAGVVVGTVIAFSLEKMVLVVYLKVKEGIKLSEYVNLKIYCIYILALIICFILSFII